MKIPKWLTKRSTQEGVPHEIDNFAKTGKVYVFGEITVGLLKRYYHKNLGRKFFKLVRLLGFYGVIFYKKLSVYSGPNEDNPKVIFIPKEHRSKKLGAYNINSLLNSCGVFSLNNLHGVPVRNYYKLFGPPLNKAGDLLFFPNRIVTANENFFSNFFKVKKTDSSNYHPINNYHSETEIEEMISTYDGIEQINQPIGVMGFSIRVVNCFRKENINSLETLVRKTEADLLLMPNFGKITLNEVKVKLASLGLNLKEEKIAKKSKTKIDLNSKDILSKLNIPIKDIAMSLRTQNCLNTIKIDFVWQLLQLTESDLLKVKSIGQKSLDEIQTIVSNLSMDFGQKFTEEDIKKIISYEESTDSDFINFWLKKTAQKLVCHTLGFLNEKEKTIIKKRIFVTKGKKYTLEEIALSFGVTRERIRQIEKKALLKIKQQFRPELREVSLVLIQQLNDIGGIANFGDLRTNFIT